MYLLLAQSLETISFLKVMSKEFYKLRRIFFHFVILVIFILFYRLPQDVQATILNLKFSDLTTGLQKREITQKILDSLLNITKEV